MTPMPSRMSPLFEGEQMLADVKADLEFGLIFMLRLMGLAEQRLHLTPWHLLLNPLNPPLALRVQADA